MVKFKDFSRPLNDFQVLFKANLILRPLQDSSAYSSTFQACAKTVSINNVSVTSGLFPGLN